MLADVERVLRTVFHPVGQSELKKWLADLSARDGVAPISRAAARATAANGSNELDEQDVVLLDTDADVVDGQEPTSLAVVNGGGGGSVTSRPRVSRSRVTTPDLPVPVDAETLADRAGPGELSLPVPADERPDRRRRRGGSGFSILFIGALLVAGAWFGGKYARVFLHLGGSEPPPAGASTGASATAPAPAAPPADQPSPRETTRSGESARAREAAKAKEADKQADKAADKAPEAAKPAAVVDAGTAAAGEDTASSPRHGSDTPPAREPSPRRRPGDKSIDFVGRDIANLKDKMAPDPSLLPPPPPAEAPPPAPAPTPAPASPDNP
ncbi:MAG TPA: hypothetical protein VLT58_10870 [Polyangia bacterium]|nr:hypothetical protein [Polyangia bacterium]